MDLSGCGPIRKPCRLCTWPDNAQPPDQAIPVPCQENAVWRAHAQARTHGRIYVLRVSVQLTTKLKHEQPEQRLAWNSLGLPLQNPALHACWSRKAKPPPEY